MIKNYLKSLVLGASIFIGVNTNAQTVSTFEDCLDFNGNTLMLNGDGYWLGDSFGDGFVNGAATFICDYDTGWGGYWSGGFSFTNNIDDTTAGYTNNYSTYTAQAFSGNQFATVSAGAYSNAMLTLDSAQEIQGFYISNTTYTALSMQQGDFFGKIFGDTLDANGSDTNHLGQTITGEDWFKVIITPYHGDSLYNSEAIDYYLADYRFADDVQDYIIDDWNWIDLTSFGEVDSLIFTLTSSDVGAGGMNTPAYFCMDDLAIGELTSIHESIQNLTSIYPNPASDRLNIKVPSTDFNVSILDNVGRVVKVSTQKSIDISDLDAGMYIVSINVKGVNVIEKLIKE